MEILYLVNQSIKNDIIALSMFRSSGLLPVHMFEIGIIFKCLIFFLYNFFVFLQSGVLLKIIKFVDNNEYVMQVESTISFNFYL